MNLLVEGGYFNFVLEVLLLTKRSKNMIYSTCLSLIKMVTQLKIVSPVECLVSYFRYSYQVDESQNGDKEPKVKILVSEPEEKSQNLNFVGS